jgi:catechol 2,3-dioxygenase-like lactoylglutathione lyase family enzyme
MLHHVSIETRPDDVEAELGFWALLGFERVDPPEALQDRAAWVERAGTQVHLLYAEQTVVPPQGHIAVVEEDWVRTVARLEGAGFEVEPRAQHWGVPRAYVHSPGGHLVELMAAPPVS